MNFTGQNLVLVLGALNDALYNVHNEIALCPDVNDPMFVEHLTELEEQGEKYEKLRDRVLATCIKEGLIEKE